MNPIHLFSIDLAQEKSQSQRGDILANSLDAVDLVIEQERNALGNYCHSPAYKGHIPHCPKEEFKRSNREYYENERDKRLQAAEGRRTAAKKIAQQVCSTCGAKLSVSKHEILSPSHRKSEPSATSTSSFSDREYKNDAEFREQNSLVVNVPQEDPAMADNRQAHIKSAEETGGGNEITTSPVDGGPKVTTADAWDILGDPKVSPTGLSGEAGAEKLEFDSDVPPAAPEAEAKEREAFSAPSSLNDTTFHQTQDDCAEKTDREE